MFEKWYGLSMGMDVYVYWCVLVGVGRVWRTWMRMYEVIGGGGHMPRYYLVHLSPSQEELAK